MCYEYSLNFHNLLKLYRVSKDYFWTFMEICSPMLKLGIRKATLMKESVEKIYSIIKDDAQIKLNAKDSEILKSFTYFVEDSFTDGSTCLRMKQLELMPYALGYGSRDMLLANSYDGFKAHIDSIRYILLGDTKLFKTCPVLYYIEKYHGDMSISDILGLPVPAILDKINERNL